LKELHTNIIAAAHAAATDAGGQRRPMVPRGDQCRCGCGSLLARVVREGLELKCRRCKDLVLITHEELIEMYRALDFERPRPGERERR
jgi:phage FluMu protein Com